MRLFTDRTGLPGPREWRNQEFPEGEARHPVTGVSWYEAAAYAEYAGKALPTLWQWEKAARDGQWTHFEGVVMPWVLVAPTASSYDRANSYGRGTEPVDAFAFGISPYGAYNMAGNVGEWILNERGAGYGAMGGSWEDAGYIFNSGEARPAIDASGAVGFRLVSRPAAGSADQGSGRIVRSQTLPPITPVDDATYQSFMSHYRYDDVEPDSLVEQLDVQLIERLETPDWTREKVTFDGVEDRVIAYLYLPKSAQPPFQLINWIVSGTAFQGRTAAQEVEAIMGPQIKGGRAVFAVVPRGGDRAAVGGLRGCVGSGPRYTRPSRDRVPAWPRLHGDSTRDRHESRRPDRLQLWGDRPSHHFARRRSEDPLDHLHWRRHLRHVPISRDRLGQLRAPCYTAGARLEW